MGKTTIEWTAIHHPDGSVTPGYSFNPWVGCQKVSDACRSCYAEGWAKRTGQAGLWRGERRRTSAANWRLPLKWNRETPGARVFCASLADVFEAGEQLDDWRMELFDLISRTPDLIWLLLTKRPENAARWFRSADMMLPNVWVGTTCENQATADERIPHLLRVPARVRFLSCEPLLGPLQLDEWLYIDTDVHPDDDGMPVYTDIGRQLHWVIAGGESGPSARPMHPDWARALRDQCVAAGVPFFFKQWGEWAPGEAVEQAGHDWPGMYEQDPRDGGASVRWWPDAPIRALAEERGRPVRPSEGPIAGDTAVLRVGKARAGRVLDGRVWDEVPR